MIKTENLQSFIHQLTNKYIAFFDVYRGEQLGSTPLAFMAEFKRRDERYLLTKDIKVWGVENQQYVFVATTDKQVSQEFLHQFQRDIEQAIPQYIPAHTEHMSTIFLGVIVTDQPVDHQVVKGVRKYRKIKFIKFGLHGWVEVYVAIVDLPNVRLSIHPKGATFIEPLEKMLREGF